MKATAKAEVEKGRLFVGVDNKDHPTQTLIVAASTRTAAKAEASATWTGSIPPSETTTTQTTTTTSRATTSTTPSNAFTVPPTTSPPPQAGTLPNTGASVLPVLGVAMVLIGAGVGALLLQRRRRTS